MQDNHFTLVVWQFCHGPAQLLEFFAAYKLMLDMGLDPFTPPPDGTPPPGDKYGNLEKRNAFADLNAFTNFGSAIDTLSKSHVRTDHYSLRQSREYGVFHVYQGSVGENGQNSRGDIWQ